MAELLDGYMFCEKCKTPMLSDGKGFYQHIFDLPLKRLQELLHDSFVAGKVFDWLGSVELDCPCCGPKPNPFKNLPKNEVVWYLGTDRGAKDLFRLLQDLFHQPLDHPREMKTEDVLAEAERILKEAKDN